MYSRVIAATAKVVEDTESEIVLASWSTGKVVGSNVSGRTTYYADRGSVEPATDRWACPVVVPTEVNAVLDVPFT